MPSTLESGGWGPGSLGYFRDIAQGISPAQSARELDCNHPELLEFRHRLPEPGPANLDRTPLAEAVFLDVAITTRENPKPLGMKATVSVKQHELSFKGYSSCGTWCRALGSAARIYHRVNDAAS
jgi:hypothetical protein